jgi:hypothetical protein
VLGGWTCLDAWPAGGYVQDTVAAAGAAGAGSAGYLDRSGGALCWLASVRVVGGVEELSSLEQALDASSRPMPAAASTPRRTFTGALMPPRSRS